MNNIERKPRMERKLTVPASNEPSTVKMILEGPVPQVPSTVMPENEAPSTVAPVDKAILVNKEPISTKKGKGKIAVDKVSINTEEVVINKKPSTEKELRSTEKVFINKEPSTVTHVDMGPISTKKGKGKIAVDKVPTNTEEVVIKEPEKVIQVEKVTTEKETRERRVGIGISLGLVAAGLLAADLAVYLLARNNDSSNAAINNALATTVTENYSNLKTADEAVWAAINNIVASTPTMKPAETATSTAVTPTETSTQVPVEAIRYTKFANANEVVQVRGGNPGYWISKVEVRDGKDSLGKPDPTDVRYGHAIDGSETQITLVKNEWMYQGPITDLKSEYQIPQTVEAIAKQLGGNVKPENIRVIRITHDKTSRSYAKWMDLWQVEEGTIVGYELMQNHQTIDGSTSGNGLKPYEFNLPPGAVVEAYDDRQTEEPADDVAAAIFNPTGKSMKLFVSGGTVWPWGDVNALIIEQGNFENGAPGASSSAVIDGKVVKLNVASNVLSPQTAHDIANIDPSTGRIALTGFVNNPGKDPVENEAAH